MPEQQGIRAGQSVSFRLPVDTPPEVIAFLNAFPEKKRSSIFAGLVIRMAQQYIASGDQVVLQVPDLSPEQKEWLSLPLTQKTIGTLLVSLLQNPGALLTAAPAAVPHQVEAEKPQEGSGFKTSEFHKRLAQSNFDED